MELHSKKQTTLCNILTFVITAAIVITLSFLCPLLSDDWHFFFVWEDFDLLPGTKRIANMEDILLSMQNYYRKSGGRVVSHFIVYCILTCPKWIFNILNGLIFAAGCYLSYRLLVLTVRKDQPFMFPLVSLLHFVTLPSFGDNVLWLSGSINYLWPSVLLLSCVFWLFTKWENAGTASYFLMLPVFMLSAATNEITGGMLLAALVLRVWIAEKKHIIRCILMAVCMIPSICLVVLAPGNTVRRMTIEKADDPTIMSFLKTLLTYWCHMFSEHRLLMYISTIGLIMFLLQKQSLKKIIETHYFFIVGAAGISALGLLGFFTYRPIILGFIVLLPAMYQSVVTICQQYRKHRTDFFAFLILLLQSVLYTAAFAMLCETSGFHGKELVYVLLTIGMLILTALIIILAVRLPNIIASVRISEKDKTTMDKIRHALSAHMRHIAAGFAVLLGISFLVSTVSYLKWNKECRAYQQKVAAHIASDDLEAAYRTDCGPPDYAGFVPFEYYAVPAYYFVEWYAAYQGADTEEFVQEIVIPARGNNP